MSVEFIDGLEKLVQLEEKTDKNNAIIVDEMLHKLNNQLDKNIDDIVQLGNQSTILPIIINKIIWLREQELNLLDEKDQQNFEQAMSWLRDYEISIEHRELEQDELFEELGMIQSCSYIEPTMPTLIRKNGNEEISKVLREILSWLGKQELKSFIELSETIKEMDLLQNDLDRESRKFQLKLQKRSKQKLLGELHEEKRNYYQDIMLLINGLLETDGINFYQVKTQLDEQYRSWVQEKIVRISKLVNMNEKMLIDREKLEQTIQEFKKKSECLINTIIKAHKKK